jgi:imidazolonepropionase-like amidohydrolase
MNCYKKVLLSLVLLMLLFTNSNAQITAPAPAQSTPIALKGATLHIGNGQIIENSLVVFNNGKITFVGAASTGTLPANALLIDVSGQQMYPGLIAPNTSLGLLEIDEARATHDNSEIGLLNPSIRALIAYNTDSKIIPTVRTNGVLLTQATPDGGLISGQSSIFQLDGWNWEDAVYKSDDGMHINWPYMTVGRAAEGSTEDPNARWKDQVNELTKIFQEAKVYDAKAQTVNLKLQALHAAANGKQKVYFHLHTLKEMIAAVSFIKTFQLDAVFVGAEEAYLATNLLKENNIPVILAATHSLPSKNDEDIQQPYKTPAVLYNAGVLFCFSHRDFSGNQRNLPFQAGTAVAYGLPKEEALKALTLNTAKILGIDATTGSIEVGKDATIIVSKGDVLDMKSSSISYAFIQGRPVELKNQQNALYEKYKAKYQADKK